MKIGAVRKTKSVIENKIRKMLNEFELVTDCQVKGLNFTVLPGMVNGKRITKVEMKIDI